MLNLYAYVSFKIEVMRKFTIILLTLSAILFNSCFEDNDDNAVPVPAETTINVSGRFTHKLPNCDNTGMPEVNCTESVHFVDGANVSYLIGGSDIVSLTSYTKTGNLITFIFGESTTLKVSFMIQNETTLKRVEDGAIWNKE